MRTESNYDQNRQILVNFFETDRMAHSEVHEFGPFRVDPEIRLLFKGNASLALGPQSVALLNVFLENRDQWLSPARLIREAWQGSHIEPTGLREYVRQIRYVLGRDSYGRCIETKPKIGYRFNSDVLKELLEDDGNGPRVHVSAAVTPKSDANACTAQGLGFDLVVDGFIGNTAAELIFDDESTRSIRSRCSNLYEACLRDLSFGLVYASHILTAADFRPSFSRPNPPGKELFRMIEEVGGRITLDQDLAGGAVVSLKRAEILADVEYLGQCVLDSRMQPLFKEFMAQEAQKHLGSDDSLFTAGLQPAEYRYDTKRDYYLDPSIQDALGTSATDVLVSFLPKDKDREPYARDALIQFATRNALTLVAIMWEYDLIAERRQMWRLPHILRSLVKQKSRERSLVQRQQELRELVVRNALLPVLKRSERKSKHLLVGRLLDQRDDPVFRQVREVLAEENLMLLEPDPLKEKQAQRVLRNIKNLAGSFENDEFILKRRSALRKLDTAMGDEFEKALYHLFPELDVAVPLVGSLSKKYDGP